MLNEILGPISIKYCRSGVNEYCKDSSSYLEELNKWKTRSPNNAKSHLVAADVQKLYPSLNRGLVESALNDALENNSDFLPNAKGAVVKLTMFCLNNILFKFQNKFYIQEKGVITGENNSVALANLSLHYIINQIQEIKLRTEIFNRFIDDIIFISKNQEDAEYIKNKLLTEFSKQELKLTFREINTEESDGKLEFLDVLHCIDDKFTNGFKTRNFIKPTALDSVFLNGSSYHPRHIFKGIITGEAKRLLRLNDCNEDYQISLNDLQNKCLRSGFKKELVEKNIKIVQTWNKNQQTNNNSENKINNNNKMNWPTEFKNIIKLNRAQKKLMPNACTTYCKPPTLANHLLHYRKISQETGQEEKSDRSKKCGSCGLCGHHGKLQNMVWDRHTFQNKTGKSFRSKHHLNCKDFGVYAGQCKFCREFYVGQTKNSFSTRWNSHRSIWNGLVKTGIKSEDNIKDDQALFLHSKTKHQDIMQENPSLAETYNVIFLEKPNLEFLDISENFWITKLQPGINIMKTYLPNYKTSNY